LTCPCEVRARPARPGLYAGARHDRGDIHRTERRDDWQRDRRLLLQLSVAALATGPALAGAAETPKKDGTLRVRFYVEAVTPDPHLSGSKVDRQVYRPSNGLHNVPAAANATVSSRERANASRGLLDREVRRQRRDCQRRGCRRPWVTASTTISSGIVRK
jgi:hypothetical protein